MSGDSSQFDRTEQATERDEEFVNFMLHPEDEMTLEELQNRDGVALSRTNQQDDDEERDISTLYGDHLGTPISDKEAEDIQDEYRGNQ